MGHKDPQVRRAYDQRRSRAGYHLKNRYRISLVEYDKMLDKQGGHCVFCTATCETNGHKLAVDHDKMTGRFRGVLCRRHNAALGTFGDTETSILRVLDYVRGK